MRIDGVTLYHVLCIGLNASGQEMLVIVTGISTVEFCATASLLEVRCDGDIIRLGSRQLLCAQFTSCCITSRYPSAGFR